MNFLFYTYFLFLETFHSVDIRIKESTGLGTIGDAMRAILGILDAANGNPVLYGFDHAFRHQESEFLVILDRI